MWPKGWLSPQVLPKIFFMRNAQKLTNFFQKKHTPQKRAFFLGGGGSGDRWSLRTMCLGLLVYIIQILIRTRGHPNRHMVCSQPADNMACPNSTLVQGLCKKKFPIGSYFLLFPLRFPSFCQLLFHGQIKTSCVSKLKTSTDSKEERGAEYFATIFLAM